jgi:hypothetical protein
MKKTYLCLPMFLLLASAFFSLSSVVNAADVYQLCAQGNKEACFKVKDIQKFYDLKKMLVLWEHLKKIEKFPICDPRFCDPSPEFFDELQIDSVEYREILIDLVDNLDKEIETLDKFN